MRNKTLLGKLDLPVENTLSLFLRVLPMYRWAPICLFRLRKLGYSVEMFSKRNTALSKEIEQLRESETDLLRQKSEGNKRNRAAAELIPTTQHILDSYDALTVEEKNSLWKLVMRRATIYREPEGEVHIHIYPNLPR